MCTKIWFKIIKKRSLKRFNYKLSSQAKLSPPHAFNGDHRGCFTSYSILIRGPCDVFQKFPLIVMLYTGLQSRPTGECYAEFYGF